jgi:hypothetical protein
MAPDKQCFLHFLSTVSLAAVILSYPPTTRKRNPAGCAHGAVISIVRDKNLFSSVFIFMPFAEWI